MLHTESKETVDLESLKGLLRSRDPKLVKSLTSGRNQPILLEQGYSSEQELRNQLAATLKETDRQFGSLQIAFEFADELHCMALAICRIFSVSDARIVWLSKSK